MSKDRNISVPQQQQQEHPYSIDDEKLDYIESQPSSDTDDMVDEPTYKADHYMENNHHNHHNVNRGINDNRAPPVASSYHGCFAAYHNNRSNFHHLLAFLICTGLFFPAVVIHKEGNILVLSLLYAAIVWWLVVQHLPKGTISRPVGTVWNAGAKVLRGLPLWLQRAIGFGIPPVALILTAALRPNDSHGTRSQRLTSCLGLVVLVSLTVLCSKVMTRRTCNERALGGCAYLGVMTILSFSPK